MSIQFNHELMLLICMVTIYNSIKALKELQ